MTDTLNKEDRLSISLSILKAELPLFPTKKAALTAAKEFGWRDAIRLDTRFERVWVVGKKLLQPDDVAGETVDVFSFPLLRWDVGKDGIKRNPVLQVRRHRKGASHDAG